MTRFIKKFVVKWNNELFESVGISRNKNCIVLYSSKQNFHATKHVKSGKVHITFEYPDCLNKNDELLNNVPLPPYITIERNEHKTHIYLGEDFAFDNIRSHFNLGGTICRGALTKVRGTVSQEHELVDLDSFNCNSPNIIPFLTPLDYDLNKIPSTCKGVTRIVKFDDAWVVLKFMDGSQPIKTDNVGII